MYGNAKTLYTGKYRKAGVQVKWPGKVVRCVWSK